LPKFSNRVAIKVSAIKHDKANIKAHDTSQKSNHGYSQYLEFNGLAQEQHHDSRPDQESAQG